MSRRRAGAAALAAVGLAWGLAWTVLPGMPTALAQADTDPDQSVDPPIESMPPLDQPPPAAKTLAHGPVPLPASIAPAASWQPRAIAELAALDKVADRSATLNVPVGGAIQFEHLGITVRACVVRGPDQAPNAAAFLQIADAQSDARSGGPAFSGWMLAAEPSVAMLQHPVYDVRVVACR